MFHNEDLFYKISFWKNVEKILLGSQGCWKTGQALLYFISHIEKATLLFRCSTNQIQELTLTALYNSLLLT